ncbi:hypothetical protein [Mycobacterium parmense]|nr:hypothetical protein [Mycobacterium parmense]
MTTAEQPPPEGPQQPPQAASVDEPDNADESGESRSPDRHT